MPGAVLISPSADYRGVDAFDDVDRIRTEQGFTSFLPRRYLQSFGDSRKLSRWRRRRRRYSSPKECGTRNRHPLQDPAIANKMSEWMIGLL